MSNLEIGSKVKVTNYGNTHEIGYIYKDEIIDQKTTARTYCGILKYPHVFYKHNNPDAPVTCKTCIKCKMIQMKHLATIWKQI